jgi:hypothetical protein
MVATLAEACGCSARTEGFELQEREATSAVNAANVDRKSVRLATIR